MSKKIFNDAKTQNGFPGKTNSCPYGFLLAIWLIDFIMRGILPSQKKYHEMVNFILGELSENGNNDKDIYGVLNIITKIKHNGITYRFTDDFIDQLIHSKNSWLRPSENLNLPTSIIKAKKGDIIIIAAYEHYTYALYGEKNVFYIDTLQPYVNKFYNRDEFILFLIRKIKYSSKSIGLFKVPYDPNNLEETNINNNNNQKKSLSNNNNNNNNKNNVLRVSDGKNQNKYPGLGITKSYYHPNKNIYDVEFKLFRFYERFLTVSFNSQNNKVNIWLNNKHSDWVHKNKDEFYKIEKCAISMAQTKNPYR